MKLPGYIKEMAGVWSDSYLISFELTPEDFCALIEHINGRFNERIVLVSGPEEIGKTTAYVYWSKSLAEAKTPHSSTDA
jgi:hypothetical protein